MIEQASAHDRVAAPPNTKALTALLVEDEVLVAMVVEENLQDLGFETNTVSSAAAAIQALAGDALPTLAIIDVGLPDERGDQLARRLRTAYPDLLIIIASGYDEAELRAGFLGDKSVTVLAKPYTQSDLLRAVRALGLDQAAN